MSAASASSSDLGLTESPIASASGASAPGSRLLATVISMPLRAKALANRAVPSWSSRHLARTGGVGGRLGGDRQRRPTWPDPVRDPIQIYVGEGQDRRHHTEGR
jgi:hypothetical protein